MKIVSFHVKRARFQLGPVFHFPVRKMPRSLENDVLPFDFNQNFGLASATIFFIIMEKIGDDDSFPPSSTKKQAMR